MFRKGFSDFNYGLKIFFHLNMVYIQVNFGSHESFGPNYCITLEYFLITFATF